MRYHVGDLVRARFESERATVGVVVGVGKANDKALTSSKHSETLVNFSPDIYYVFFSESGHDHPFFAAELSLESEAPVGTTV